MRIAIAGATGNLGLFLTRYLCEQSNHELVMLMHRRPVPEDILVRGNVTVRTVDLGDQESVRGCCAGVDCVVSMSGVLFRGGARNFLPITNTKFVAHLAEEAAGSGVKKFILLSFPHVEGETTPENRATGQSTDISPGPIHAKTRLDAEHALVAICKSSGLSYLILRAGIVYGKGVKLVEAARKLLRVRAFPIWKKPTWIHLLSLADLLCLIHSGIETPNMRGIYNLGDDDPMLLQDCLDQLAAHWGYKKPIRLPEFFFHAVAHACEVFSRVTGLAVPLTPDILRMGMMSSVADTTRIKKDLHYQLVYPSLRTGIDLL